MAILFAVLGCLLVGIGWPLARRRVGPNRWYGLRVPPRSPTKPSGTKPMRWPAGI